MNEADKPVTGAILGGGASMRMGADKATLELAGKPMAAWVAGALQAGGLSEMVILGPQSVAGIRSIPDSVAGSGPLAAIVGALEQLGDLFVSPCDVPTLSSELVKQILFVSRSTPRPVVLAFSDRLEPLIGVYKASAAATLRQAHQAGAYGPKQALQPGIGPDIAYVTVGTAVEEVRNVNEPSDLAAIAAQLADTSTESATGKHRATQ